MTTGKGIIVGITGGIAAYKACDLIRLFVKGGFAVYPLMTKATTEFITPFLVSHLASHKTYVDMFDKDIDWNVEHVELVNKAQAMVIAPATADIIAKIATGIADDFVSLTAMTFTGDGKQPLIIAPSMNYRMYRHPATVKNIETLMDRGVIFVQPETGLLACGEVGEGKLSPVDEIYKTVLRSLGYSDVFEGVRAIVTAGGTREPIDPVRYIGNRSSGKMGYAIAMELKRRGATVTLISSSTMPNPGVDEFIEVETVQELKNALDANFESCDILVMTAAVSDFTVLDPASQKISRKTESLEIHLKPTEDLIASLAKRKGDRIIVGFAAETIDLATKAREKLRTKGIDMIVANDISRKDIGFSSDFNEIVIIRDGVETVIDKAPKSFIASEIVENIADIMNKKKNK